MIIQCKSCSKKFLVRDIDIPKNGRTVQCSNCSSIWNQMPVAATTKILKEKKSIKSNLETDKSPALDSVKASDGKTYRFLGNQWAELLSSGKAGLLAKKKISKELNKITGRKENKIYKKKPKNIHELNPSESISNEKKLPDLYTPKGGLGFFGYLFLVIIIGFSFVGILRTFENDLINNFPETLYIYELLDEQTEYFSETFRNMVIIVKDLMNSY